MSQMLFLMFHFLRKMQILAMESKKIHIFALFFNYQANEESTVDPFRFVHCIHQCRRQNAPPFPVGNGFATR
jgi:hypothetical protein